jgi:serine O-acetyltransferase
MNDLLLLKMKEIRKANGTYPDENSIQSFIRDIYSFLFKDELSDNEDFIEKSTNFKKRFRDIISKESNKVNISADELVDTFFLDLLSITDQSFEDSRAILAFDPATDSIDEITHTYPGFYAIAVYRIAHCWWKYGMVYSARIATEFVHSQTGIDIHPGAEIGKSFAIDHGTGIVIGETTVIGDHVKLYQGVTLGALQVGKRFKSEKRHPTIGNYVTIYANATILGGETEIGAGSTIGGNVWLTRSIPPCSLVYHKREVIIKEKGLKNEPINFII